MLPHWQPAPDTWQDSSPSLSVYNDTRLSRSRSTFIMLSVCERTASTIFKVLSMTRPGIQLTTSRAQKSHCADAMDRTRIIAAADLITQKVRLCTLSQGHHTFYKLFRLFSRSDNFSVNSYFQGRRFCQNRCYLHAQNESTLKETICSNQRQIIAVKDRQFFRSG